MLLKKEKVAPCHSVCINPDPLQSLQANALKTIMYVLKGIAIGWTRMSLSVHWQYQGRVYILGGTECSGQ